MTLELLPCASAYSASSLLNPTFGTAVSGGSEGFGDGLQFRQSIVSARYVGAAAQKAGTLVVFANDQTPGQPIDRVNLPTATPVPNAIFGLLVNDIDPLRSTSVSVLVSGILRARVSTSVAGIGLPWSVSRTELGTLQNGNTQIAQQRLKIVGLNLEATTTGTGALMLFDGSHGFRQEDQNA